MQLREGLAMKDTDRTPEQLIQELEMLRARMTELEQVEAERKRAEAALRSAEAKYRIVADNTYDWEFWISPQGQFIYSSPSCERITGHTAAEFEAEPDLLARIIHPDDLALFTAHVRESIAKQVPSYLTFRITRPDGDERWVEHFCRPILDSDGRHLGCRGSNRDITKRKRIEASLEESEEIFKLFMEHSPIYVFFKDEKTRGIRLSKNYEKMLGRPVHEMLGKTMDELFPSELAKSMTEDDLKVLRDGTPIEVVEELNGRIYTTTKFPIIKQGKPSLLAGFTIDITERDRAEKELQQRNLEVGITQR